MGVIKVKSRAYSSMVLSWIGILGCTAPCIASADGFRWYEPVVHTAPWDVANEGVLGVRAIAMPSTRDRIASRTYTPEERRNVQTVIDDFMKPRPQNGVGSQARAPDAKGSIGPMGFYVMHTAFINEFNLKRGSNDGYSQFSTINRVQTIEEIVAKGNRVVLGFRITANAGGPLFGFKPYGQPINIREQLRYSFDSEGRVQTFVAWSGEDMPFYQQLGGKLEFAKTLNPVALTVRAPRIVDAAPPPATRTEAVDRLVKPVPYDDRERRNIETLLNALDRREGLEVPSGQYAAKGYRNTDGSPYPTLNMAYGRSDGFKLGSLSKVKRQVTDLLVNGNRAWVYYVTTAQHDGPLFGVAGDGKEISWDESAFVTFDGDGKIIETTRFPVQGELYLKLGGQYTFPYGRYWSCDGCPNMPGIATLAIPPGTP